MDWENTLRLLTQFSRGLAGRFNTQTWSPLVDDMAQEAAIRLLAQLNRGLSLRDHGNPNGYLWRVVWCAWADYFRKKSNREGMDYLGLYVGINTAASGNVEDEVLQSLFEADVQRVMNDLPSKYRGVLALRLEGCSYQEMVVAMGCPLNTVKSRLNYARHRMRHLWGEHEAVV